MPFTIFSKRNTYIVPDEEAFELGSYAISHRGLGAYRDQMVSPRNTYMVLGDGVHMPGTPLHPSYIITATLGTSNEPRTMDQAADSVSDVAPRALVQNYR